jgi:hypothetical protein
MQNYIQLAALIAFFAFVPHSIKRRRETDKLGNATLRYFGPSLLALFVGLFFLYQAIKNQSTPFYQQHPENFYIELFFCFAGLLVAVWLFFAKATLTNKAIEDTLWPFTLRYPLDQLTTIKKKQFVIVHFKDGRKFGVLPFASGQQYFLEQLV